jgi:hypothetical protein
MFFIGAIKAKIATLRPQAVTGGGEPLGMVSVRQAGAEVGTTFWAKLAGDRGWLARLLEAQNLERPNPART